MKVIIETTLNIIGSRGLRRGEFFVSDREFKDDANFAVAIVAYEWIQEQIKESSSR
ncbi:hypothetical protein LIT38_14850 [Bacillus sp. CMF12]|uniref:hypothetical protein n=1 Tax=Bacillus sp. CMF12 TaxID=2884834 RepID=UPI00207B05B6|nr:hypothetical protein [Bacillus sp. CMF12]USK47878.1 hypothetical protein LIT38_14850 [Bacillus sp. CMF12]